MFVSGFLIAAILVCAAQAIRASRLLSAAVWLAGASALTALWLYLLGAAQLAVIELSVSAGLVTVLFVFAITISGAEAFAAHSRVPKWLALVLVLGAILLLTGTLLPIPFLTPTSRSYDLFSLSMSNVFWNDRALDVLVQIALIFASVLGVLNLIGHEAIETKQEVVSTQTRERVEDQIKVVILNDAEVQGMRVELDERKDKVKV